MLAPKVQSELCLSRRVILASFAGAAFTNAAKGEAIEDAPASGTGWIPGNQYSAQRQAALQGIPLPTTPPAPRPQAAISEEGDWRAYLLQGERSILMRRGGAAQTVRYCTKDGLLDMAGYQEACMLLRDVKAGKMMAMDPRLLDVLCGMQRWMDYNGRSSVIEITSGFRTLATNGASEGAAKNSMHLVGKAADIVIPGVSSAVLGAMAKQFNGAGGVGIYLNRGFVHVDTGAARIWISSARSRTK